MASTAPSKAGERTATLALLRLDAPTKDPSLEGVLLRRTEVLQRIL